ncbi:unnamed protein product [Adineta steineri]|uniref:Uncharacterized protein n=2 Tax=Adineta steineri TaxID=433720 RepID=A0A814YIJ8_9BILA|nr:unnamed protein product [Adineta steineri]
MIDDLRTVVYKNIRELGGPSSSSSSTNEYLQAPMPSTILSHPQQFTENDSSHSHQLVSGSEEEEMEVNDNVHSNNKTLMKKIRGTTKKTIQQAEEGFIRLDHVIKQLRTSIQKK